MDRLIWRRVAPRTFIAYPTGDTDKYARVGATSIVPTDGYRWSWTVEWKGRFQAVGLTETKQRAADAATEAWWAQVAKTDAAEAERAALEAVLARIEAGQFNPSELDLRAPYDDLMRLMDQCVRRRPGAANPEGYNAVIKALSAEFYRRLTAE